ncbi:hypothetical protein BT93_D1333 [Corymbia citriodora subsp. variegata]|nr:hypothetical protein BT93_D1333 [Corymbia citriodora subsp. variegata]
MVHLASVSGAIHLRLRLDRLRLHLWVVSLAVGFFFFRLRRWVLGRLRRRPVLGSVRHCQHQERSSRSPQALADIVLYLCEKEHIEGDMIFQLLEDLTEMSTMRNCKDIFGYIESKQDILGKQELFARGKLVMLRTCNQLLRRLSKVP